jgi:hypothetical protein
MSANHLLAFPSAAFWGHLITLLASFRHPERMRQQTQAGPLSIFKSESLKVTKNPPSSGGFVFRVAQAPQTESVLLDGFDLGHGQLTVFLVQGAGHFDRLGLAANLSVESLGDVASQLVGGRLGAFLHFNDVLALVGLLEGALEALAFAGKGHFLGESSSGKSSHSRDSENQFHGVFG